eukprot:Phypoly_transcript_05643.p1 GENE.Phypoly_transcript_05643~~Phypoly_transcript_05643.p1  ORF type:complete len:468 (+),score=65.36 Phypoly_transcript_05643:144-1547(+)
MNYPPSLNKFFVFDRRLGTKEGTEEEKILYFYPPNLKVEDKTNHVGLCEGIIQFAGTFSPTKPCNSVHREKQTICFYNPEPFVWMILIIKNPYTTRTTRDGKTTIQFLEEEVDDILLQTIVTHCYKTFKMFNGPFQLVLDNSGPQGAIHRLAAFMPHYINSINFETMDIFITLEGIQFLPVDKNVYLRVQSFINLTEDNLINPPLSRDIQYAGLLYKDNLVWSGLEQDDMRIMYSYLVSPLAAQEPTTRGSDFSFPVKIRGRQRFVTGPERLSDDSPISAPKVYIGPESKEYYLIVYELADIISLLLVDAIALKDHSLFQQLDTFIAPHINFLSPILAEHYSRKSGSDDQYRYIYFNHMNFAMKTVLKQKGAELPKETLRLLAEIHNDFETQRSTPSEVLIRTATDRWIVGRKSDQREFFVFFDQRNANLLEINGLPSLSSTFFAFFSSCFISFPSLFLFLFLDPHF